jgi:hypothetical protein
VARLLTHDTRASECPLRRDPERFHVEKTCIVQDLERLASMLDEKREHKIEVTRTRRVAPQRGWGRRPRRETASAGADGPVRTLPGLCQRIREEHLDGVALVGAVAASVGV